MYKIFIIQECMVFAIHKLCDNMQCKKITPLIPYKFLITPPRHALTVVSVYATLSVTWRSSQIDFFCPQIQYTYVLKNVSIKVMILEQTCKFSIFSTREISLMWIDVLCCAFSFSKINFLLYLLTINIYKKIHLLVGK